MPSKPSLRAHHKETASVFGKDGSRTARIGRDDVVLACRDC